MPKLEIPFKRASLKRIESMFPGIIIISGNSAFKQGIPDTLLLYGDKWAALEYKRSPTADKQPNQDYYVDLMNEWSFAAFIYPENEGDVLDALQRSFRSSGNARISKRQ